MDDRILDLVRECEPVKLWSVLNIVAAELSAVSRAGGREARMKLWEVKVRRLLRLKLLFRLRRNEVATYKPEPRPAGIWKRRRTRTVGERISAKGVSTVKSPKSPEQGCRPHPFPAEVFTSSPGREHSPPTEPKTESAPDPALITQAAKSLARQPRNQPRKLTGWIGSKRAFRDMAIWLPNGTQAWVFGALRQQVVFTFDKGWLLGTLTPEQRWGVLPASAVEIVRDPHAALLGRLKAGTIERKSEAKARAARLNGLRPCHPGKRRGRPRISQSARPVT